MLISRIKRTFISDIFNSAKQSLQLLAVYSNSFNQAMSNIKNASAQLSANVAASLGGLIEKLEPIITRIIDGISKAITYVSAFFGIISGKNTMIVAKKQNDSYRNSLYGVSNQAASASSNLNSASSAASSYGNSLGSASNANTSYSKSTKSAAKGADSYAGSAEEAAEAVKELNRQQYGFDELNKRNADDIDDNVNALDNLADSLADTYDPSNYDPYSGSYNPDSNNPGSSGNYDPLGGLDPQAVQDAADMFEEVPIDTVLPEKLSNLFDELKKLWDEGDYFNFGKLLGEGLGSLLQSVDDWINNVLRPKGVEWAGIAAEVLNGVVNGLPWELLGKTIADGLNAVFDIVNTFLTKFNFEDLGKGIGRAIRDLFDHVEWALIAETFANGWNALIDTIHGIVTTPGIWKSIGSSIGEYISSWFSNIDFPKLGETIATTVEGIATSLKFAAQNIQERSHEISDNLSAGLNNLFSADWADVGKQAGNFVLTILDTLLETVKKTEWDKVGRAIGEFLGNIPWGKIFADVAAIIWEVASGVIEGLLDTKGGKIAVLLGAKILAIKALFDAAAMAGTVAKWISAISTAFPTVLPAVAEFASGIGTTLAGIIPAATAFVANLGTALAPIAAAIFSPTGLIIMAIIAAAALIITHWDEIKEAATRLTEWIGQAWEKLKTYTSEKWEGLKTTVSQKAADVRQSVVSAWSTLSTEAAQRWDGLKTAVSDKFSAVKTSVATIADNVKTTLSRAWDETKRTTETAWSTLQTTVKTQFEKVKTPVDTTVKTVQTNLTRSWTNIKTDAQRSWQAILTTITQPLQKIPQSVQSVSGQISSAFQRIWSGVQTQAQNAWNTITSGMQRLWSSIQSGLSSLWSSVSSGLSRLWSQVQSGLSSLWSSAQSMAGNLVSGLANGLSRGWNALSGAVSNLGSRVVNGFNNFFGIHSPSTVFAEMGKFLDLGLAQGIDKYERKVLSSVSNMAENVADEVDTSGAAFKIGTESDDLVSKLSGVSDRLSNIANVFREINNALSSMGGLLTPAIATGTVVPYSTRINPVTNGGGTDLSALSSDLDERMYDMVSLLRKILERLERTKNIDDEKLAESIAFAMRSEARGFGAV